MKRQRWFAQRPQRPAAAFIMRLKLRLILLVVGVYAVISAFILCFPQPSQTFSPASDVRNNNRKISYDVDGTASSCRCSLLPHQQQPQDVWRWPPRRVEDLICPNDSTYDLTLCVAISGTGVVPTKLDLRLDELRHRKSRLQHAIDGWSLLRQWYELEDDDKLEQYDMYTAAINATPYVRNISAGWPVNMPPINNVNVKLLRTSRLPTLYSGQLLRNYRVIRPHVDPRLNKYATSEDDVPWPVYPPYLAGQHFFIGPQVLSDLVVAMAYTRYHSLDDTFLAFSLAKLPYQMEAMPALLVRPHDSYSWLYWLIVKLEAFFKSLEAVFMTSPETVFLFDVHTL
ncbi:hypothetical protein AAHC03_020766 [Spirometra sp. Aus1]